MKTTSDKLNLGLSFVSNIHRYRNVV